MIEPTDLAMLPVTIDCKNSVAPAPLTSNRFNAVMSYIATPLRVIAASAATVGVQ